MMATVAPDWQIIAHHRVCLFEKSHFAIVDSSRTTIGKKKTNCFMVYFSNYILLKIHWREEERKKTTHTNTQGLVLSLHFTDFITNKRRDKFSMALQTNCPAVDVAALDGIFCVWPKWKLHSEFCLPIPDGDQLRNIWWHMLSRCRNWCGILHSPMRPSVCFFVIPLWER